MNDKQKMPNIIQCYYQRLKNHQFMATFYKDLIFHVLPVLEEIDSPKINKWKKESDNYQDQSSNLKKIIIKEIKETLNKLNFVITEQKLNEITSIREKLDKLYNFLKGKPDIIWLDKQYDAATKRIIDLEYPIPRAGIAVIPEAHITAIDLLKELLQTISENGYSDIIKEYVDSFSNIEKHELIPEKEATFQCNKCFISTKSIYKKNIVSNCKNCNSELQIFDNSTRFITHIHTFNKQTFIPTCFKLDDIQKEFWASNARCWEQLRIIAWLYNIDNKDYFKKGLNYSDPDTRQTSAELLYLNSQRQDVSQGKNIKPNSTKEALDQNYYYSFSEEDKKHLLSCLEQILSTLFEPITTKEFMNPVSLSIDVIENNIIATLKWNNQFEESKIMHAFKGKNRKKALFFFSTLINKPNSIATFNKIPQKLQEAGFIDIFKKIFVGKTSKCETSFLKNHISFADYTNTTTQKILSAFLNFNCRVTESCITKIN